MHFETLAAVFEQSGIDPGRVYVSGGTALHSYLCALGQNPTWHPGDVDLFIEFGARPFTDDMDALRKVLVQSFNCALLSPTRARAVVSDVGDVDFIFSRHPDKKVASWIKSFDFSVCKVYFPFSTWKDPAYVFADTAQRDIKDGYMRVAPKLFDLYTDSAERANSSPYLKKKLRRLDKYVSRGFDVMRDKAYSHTMDRDQNKDWESDVDNMIVAALTAEQRAEE